MVYSWAYPSISTFRSFSLFHTVARENLNEFRCRPVKEKISSINNKTLSLFLLPHKFEEKNSSHQVRAILCMQSLSNFLMYQQSFIF